MSAVAGLKSVIADGVIPAATTVGVVDPLGRRGEGASHDRALGDFEYTPWDAMSGPPNASPAPTRFDDWTDDELFETMQEQLDWFTLFEVAEQPDHFFWFEDLPPLAEEFRRRASADPGFAQRLIDEAGNNPMIGLIIARGGFGDEVLAGVTIATASNGVTAFDSGGVRSFVLDALLAEVGERTDVGVVVLADADAFEQLFTWNQHDHTTRPIDQTQLEVILADALDAPFDDASTLGDVHPVIANVVDLADHKYFDDGFPSSLAATVVDGIIPYLPYIIGSLNESAGVRIRDFDGDRAVVIGTDAEVADLFGNLLRDPLTREYLIDTILALTITADPRSDLYVLDDVKKYIDLLLKATKIEQIEEEIQATRERERWDLTIDIVFGLVDKGLAAGGEKLEFARGQLEWVEKGARWLVDRIDADGTGLDDVPLAIRIMFSLGLTIAFLARFTPDDEDEEDDVADAHDTLAEINQVLEEAEAGGAPIELATLDRMVRDLEDDIEQLDPGAYVPIEEVGLDPEVLDPERDANLTD